MTSLHNPDGLIQELIRTFGDVRADHGPEYQEADTAL